MNNAQFFKADDTLKRRQAKPFHALLRKANINPKFCDQNDRDGEFYLAFDINPDDALDYALEIRRKISNVIITQTRNSVFNWRQQNGTGISAAAVQLRLVGEPLVKSLAKPTVVAQRKTHQDYLAMVVDRHGIKPIVAEKPLPVVAERPSFARFARPGARSIFEQNQQEFAAVNAAYRNEMVQVKRVDRKLTGITFVYVVLDFSDGQREIAVELFPEDEYALKRQGFDVHMAGGYAGPMPRVTLTKYTRRWKLVDVFDTDDVALLVKGREWQEVPLMDGLEVA